MKTIETTVPQCLPQMMKRLEELKDLALDTIEAECNGEMATPSLQAEPGIESKTAFNQHRRCFHTIDLSLNRTLKFVIPHISQSNLAVPLYIIKPCFLVSFEPYLALIPSLSPSSRANVSTRNCLPLKRSRLNFENRLTRNPASSPHFVADKEHRP